jgi:hypothetical protein
MTLMNLVLKKSIVTNVGAMGILLHSTRMSTIVAKTELKNSSGAEVNGLDIACILLMTTRRKLKISHKEENAPIEGHLLRYQ